MPPWIIPLLSGAVIGLAISQLLPQPRSPYQRVERGGVMPCPSNITERPDPPPRMGLPRYRRLLEVVYNEAHNIYDVRSGLYRYWITSHLDNWTIHRVYEDQFDIDWSDPQNPRAIRTPAKDQERMGDATQPEILIETAISKILQQPLVKHDPQSY